MKGLDDKAMMSYASIIYKFVTRQWVYTGRLVILFAITMVLTDSSKAASDECTQYKNFVNGQSIETYRIIYKVSGSGYACASRATYFTDVTLVWVLIKGLTPREESQLKFDFVSQFRSRKFLFGNPMRGQFKRVKTGVYLAYFNDYNGVSDNPKVRAKKILGRNLYVRVQAPFNKQFSIDIVFNPVNPVETAMQATLQGAFQAGQTIILSDLMEEVAEILPDGVISDQIFQEAYFDILSNILFQEAFTKSSELSLERIVLGAVASLQLSASIDPINAAFLRGVLKRIAKDIFSGIILDNDVQRATGYYVRN